MNWRREEAAKGVGTPVPGGRYRGSGGGRYRGSDRIRSTQSDLKPKPAPPKKRPEDDVLDAEDLAHWTHVAAAGDRVMARVAKGVLANHERASRALGGEMGPAEGGRLA